VGPRLGLSRSCGTSGSPPPCTGRDHGPTHTGSYAHSRPGRRRYVPRVSLLGRFDPQLPREVWLLQVGGVVNSFGNGVVLPFLVIYLHDVRGFGLGTAGLAVAVASAAQLVAGVAVGPIIDRLGPRPTLAAGLVVQAVGYGLLPLVRHPWHAFALLAVEGAGAAGLFSG